MKKYLIALLATIITASASSAAISISFSYNPETNATTAYYSGSWDSFSFSNMSLYTAAEISPTSFYAFNGWFVISGENFDGQTFAWDTATADSQEGDAFAFEESNIYGYSNYQAGDPINGSLTFNETTLADLGLTLGQTGTYTTTSGNNSVSFEAVQVPEASTYAFGFGLATIGCAVIRRRARRNR